MLGVDVAIFSFEICVSCRMIASYGDSERSRLSVICQNWARIEYNTMIPSGAFIPPPKVLGGKGLLLTSFHQESPHIIANCI